jgi:hypothetical protein
MTYFVNRFSKSGIGGDWRGKRTRNSRAFGADCEARRQGAFRALTPYQSARLQSGSNRVHEEI